MTGHADILQEVRNTDKYVRSLLPNAKKEVQQMKAEFQGMKSAFPLAPNLLADTYHFAQLCQGKVNTPMSLANAHGGIWSAYLSYGGSVADGTVTVLTLDKLADHGLSPVKGDAFHLASPSASSQAHPFYGSDFRVVLVDFSITKAGGGVGYFHQGCFRATGWGAGRVKTQSSMLVNVLEQTGDTQFHVQRNMPAQLTADKSLAGKGWQHLHSTRRGFGGCHQPWAFGKGSMKLAFCLPYVGTGDHGGEFIWADSIVSGSEAKAGKHGRYTHFVGE